MASTLAYVIYPEWAASGVWTAVVIISVGTAEVRLDPPAELRQLHDLRVPQCRLLLPHRVDRCLLRPASLPAKEAVGRSSAVALDRTA